MKVFVTGGAGYIGSVTVEQLLANGHEVVVFDNLERGHREAVPVGVPLIIGDLRHAEEITSAMRQSRPDVVMHFAAYALVGESMKQPELYFENNTVGGINLLHAMRATGVNRIVFSSTCATYGQSDASFIDESTIQHPLNPYGASKLMFEQMLSWHERIHGLHWVALRYFNACGATKQHGEDHDPETHLMPLILRVAQGKSPHVTVFGNDYDTPDGTCIRDYVHVSDLAQAHQLALTSRLCGGVNLGNGRGFSVLEVIEIARQITGHPIPVVLTHRREGDPARLVACAERARDQLGWRPAFTDLQVIVETAWRWHQLHPNGWGTKNV